MGLQNLIDMVLQNFGKTYPPFHDANKAMNVKAEEVSDAEEEEDPMPIKLLEMKAEPEVSCMSLYAHSYAGITNIQKCHLSFSSSPICL
jgi:hypothetical protein